MSGIQIPNLPGYKRDLPFGRGNYAKSHHFEVFSNGIAREVARDTKVDARLVGVPPTSYTGTGRIDSSVQRRTATGTNIPGSQMVGSSSDATNYTTMRGRHATARPSQGGGSDELPPVESSFATTSQSAANDPYAHLRRNPVPKDYYNAAEPLAHLQVTESRLPSWVEYDRKVLRFSGYFAEGTNANPSEGYRIRPILLYMYLEDGTIHIAEVGQNNSGMSGGVLVRRHRIPLLPEGAKDIGIEDLYVGAELPIYGRVFRLTDADEFTRAFYTKNGASLAPPESQPIDPFNKRVNAASAGTASGSELRKKFNPATQHAEARLGKQFHSVQRVQQFLKNDGKVLRFYAVWDDQQLYGEKRPYILHYFLADDTIECLEVNQPNSGRDPFPTMLRRQRLPKDHRKVIRDVAHVGEDSVLDNPDMQYVSDRDLRVGGTVDVYGRELLLCGVDAYTREYYKKTYGLSDKELDSLDIMKDEPIEPPKVVVPPPTGFGTPEDSLGSFLALVPKAPRQNWQKLTELEGVNLRFGAVFLDPSELDAHRTFVLTYYLANDTMQLYELFERNAGHIGGKYLDRQRVMNPMTECFFEPSDLYVGGVIEVNKRKFVILEADEFSQKFMEANKQIWNKERGNCNDFNKAKQYAEAHGIRPNAASKGNTGAIALPDRRPF